LTYYPDIKNEDRMNLFHTFLMSLREHYPNLSYLGVKELHQSGLIHLHVVFDQYVDWHLAQAIWQRIGAGKVIHVKRILSCYASRYVTKYLSKGLVSGEVKRPVIQSRKFCIHLSDFLKWAEKLCSLGVTELLKWIVEKIDVKEYNSIACLRKRRHLSRLRNLALSLGL